MEYGRKRSIRDFLVSIPKEKRVEAGESDIMAVSSVKEEPQPVSPGTTTRPLPGYTRSRRSIENVVERSRLQAQYVDSLVSRGDYLLYDVWSNTPFPITEHELNRSTIRAALTKDIFTLAQPSVCAAQTNDGLEFGVFFVQLFKKTQMNTLSNPIPSFCANDTMSLCIEANPNVSTRDFAGVSHDKTAGDYTFMLTSLSKTPDSPFPLHVHNGGFGSESAALIYQGVMARLLERSETIHLVRLCWANRKTHIDTYPMGVVVGTRGFMDVVVGAMYAQNNKYWRRALIPKHTSYDYRTFVNLCVTGRHCKPLKTLSYPSPTTVGALSQMPGAFNIPFDANIPYTAGLSGDGYPMGDEQADESNTLSFDFDPMAPMSGLGDFIWPEATEATTSMWDMPLPDFDDLVKLSRPNGV